MCCENEDDKVYVCGYTRVLCADMSVHCMVAHMCSCTVMQSVHPLYYTMLGGLYVCLTWGLLSLGSSLPLIRAFFGVFPLSLLLHGCVQGAEQTEEKKKHLAILKSHHSGEEGIKAPECSPGPLRTD